MVKQLSTPRMEDIQLRFSDTYIRSEVGSRPSERTKISPILALIFRFLKKKICVWLDDKKKSDCRTSMNRH